MLSTAVESTPVSRYHAISRVKGYAAIRGSERCAALVEPPVEQRKKRSAYGAASRLVDERQSPHDFEPGRDEVPVN